MSKRFSPRITVMLFSLVAVIGLIMVSMATSIHTLMIAFLATGIFPTFLDLPVGRVLLLPYYYYFTSNDKI